MSSKQYLTRARASLTFAGTRLGIDVRRDAWFVQEESH